MSAPHGASPRRLLIVLPSWVGDAVMATPALQRIREALPGSFVGGLARPGIDRILEGLSTDAGAVVFDEMHVARQAGVLGPKRVAAKLRPRRYDAALLLTGSFSTALIARIAGVPRRVGYERDGRGFLLTDRLHPPKTAGGEWAIVPAVSYYWHAAQALLDPAHPRRLDAPPLECVERAGTLLPERERLRLAVTARDAEEARRVRASAGVSEGEGFAILNPGGNKPEKRWPAERFAALADHLAAAHGLRVLINGSPAELELCESIARAAGSEPMVLPACGGTLGALKALCADPAAKLMVTNDTGPRHIAAAMGCPVVSLFGPTDARWTTIPGPMLADGSDGEALLVADPTLPPREGANDHPERCAVDRISLGRVVEASDRLLRIGRFAPDAVL